MKIPAFYPILDTVLLARQAVDAMTAAAAILDAGATILQYRHKGFFSRRAFEEAEKVAGLCRSAKALFVVNDRADIAMLLDAALHLGQDDLPPRDARRIMPQGIIGFSTHNETQLRAGDKEAVDYLAIGPMYLTGSKENPDPVVGPDRLRALRALTTKPLVAIGGITRHTASEILKAGADSIAVIGDLFPERATGAALRARAEEWMRVTAPDK